MAEVTRFPHYHQAENVVTNHVMVMLRTLYDGSPKLLEGLLQALCSSEVMIGPRFTQQIAGTHSIPDGLVAQEPLSVFIETKLGPNIDAGQLKRHCETIAARLPGQANRFLIALTSGRGPAVVPDQVMALAGTHRIQVVSVTFAQLVEQVEQIAALPVANLTLRETIAEFATFVYAHGLAPRDELVAVLTGTSWRDNAKYGVYFEPAHRNPKWVRATFIGLYHDRQISHVGRISTAVVAVEHNAGILDFEQPETGTLTDEQKKSLQAAVTASQAHFSGFQTAPHRYYIVDQFAPTDLRKRTAGGMMGHRYLDFERITGRRLEANSTAYVAASVLAGHTYD